MAAILKPLMSLDDIVPIARGGTPIRWAGWTRDNKGINWPAQAITSCSSATDKFTLNSHGLLDGMAVMLDSTVVLPTITNPLAGETDTAMDGTLTWYVRDATLNDFKLCIYPGEDAIDLLDTGTGTITIRRAQSRLWLIFRSGEWWRIAPDNSVNLCNGNDLTDEEMQGEQWTVLAEDCLVKQSGQLVLPEWKDDVSCSDPAGALADTIIEPAAVPAESIVTPSDSTVTTVPDSGLLGSGVEGSSGGESSGAVGSGSGSSSSSGSGGGGSGAASAALLGGGAGSGGSGSGITSQGTIGGGGGDDDGDATEKERQQRGGKVDKTGALKMNFFARPVARKAQGTQVFTIFIWNFQVTADTPFANSQTWSARVVPVGAASSLVTAATFFSGFVIPGRIYEGSSTVLTNVPVGGSESFGINAYVDGLGEVTGDWTGGTWTIPNT